MKVFIDVSIQKERFEGLLNCTIKHKIHEKKGIVFVEDMNHADVIIFLVNSRENLVNLSPCYAYLFTVEKPVILLERTDSATTWVRDMHNIKNLKAVFKNRILRDPTLNNAKVFEGKYQYSLFNEKMEITNVNFERNDLSSIFHKNVHLPHIAENDCEKIKCVLWDFHSSIFVKKDKFPMKKFRNSSIKDKSIDIFCINQKKNHPCVDIPRKKAKNIVQKLRNKYKVSIDNVDPKKYEKLFSQCKIAVACWGFGEWVHMDGYAMYAGAILVKPNTDHVKMYPDIYKAYETYIPCAHDYSDLEQVLTKIMNNYENYIPMVERNRDYIMQFNEINTTEIFWENVVSSVNKS